jgi:putative tricarboxylic transport membrane protein
MQPELLDKGNYVVPKKSNLEKILNYISQAVKAKVNLISFPELILTGGQCREQFFRLKVPKKILLPLILLFCLLGTYGINNNILDVFLMTICGVAAYVLRKLEYEMAPLCLALVLGSVMETCFRQSLIISGGSLMIFVTRPITLVMLSVAVFLLAFSVFRRKISVGV